MQMLVTFPHPASIPQDPKVFLAACPGIPTIEVSVTRRTVQNADTIDPRHPIVQTFVVASVSMLLHNYKDLLYSSTYTAGSLAVDFSGPVCRGFQNKDAVTSPIFQYAN